MVFTECVIIGQILTNTLILLLRMPSVSEKMLTEFTIDTERDMTSEVHLTEKVSIQR